MPFAANSFEGALCIEVLEHARDPQFLLAETFRILKPARGWDGVGVVNAGPALPRHRCGPSRVAKGLCFIKNKYCSI